MIELDGPDFWILKGEGNANWVFGYTGSLPSLVGRVLRVRKPKPDRDVKQEALEEAVWGPVLGPLAGGAAARELAYVRLMLVPLLGQHHVPPLQPVLTSPTFIHSLLTHNGCLASIGDGTQSQPQADELNCFTASTADDAAEEAAAPCLAFLMPDVTLLADNDLGQFSAPGSSSSSSTDTSPVVCIELKPKCGFLGGTCATVHPANRDIKRSRSRYQLHQMLKLEEGKVSAASAYDPQDLFSGDPTRLRAALNALLDEPQNNLLVFLGGKQQPAGGRGSAGVAALEEPLADLLPLPASQRRAALVELLAAVLEQEGVLPRLLQAQQQCQYDIEGVYRLYCKLTGTTPTGPLIQPGHNEAAGYRAATGGISAGTSDNNSCSLDANKEEAAEVEADHGHAAAMQQLLAMPLYEAHAMLRSYVVAATAKDCAIMITLQRLQEGLPSDAPSPADSGIEEQGCSAGALQCRNPSEQPQQQHQQQHQQQLVEEESSQVPGRLYCAAAGGWYACRLSVVDLDLKPLAKIPQHYKLDAAILAAARRSQPGSNGSGKRGLGAEAGAAADAAVQHIL